MQSALQARSQSDISVVFQEELDDESLQDLNDEVNRWRQHESRKYLKSITPVVNCHYSEMSGIFKGAAYVSDENMPASAVVMNADICGTIGIYRITSFDKLDATIDQVITQRIATINQEKIFIDTSHPEYAGHEGVGLGEHNCEVSAFKSIVNPDTLEEAWHVVIRAYHTASSRKLLQMIQEDQSMTIGDLYRSKAYKNALESSEIVRDVLAARVASHLGVKLGAGDKQVSFMGETVTCATPNEVHYYNVIQKIQNYNGSPAYAYYSGCAGFAEHNPSMLLVSLGPTKGYMLLNYGNKLKLAVGNTKTAHAFPLSVPRRKRDIEFVSRGEASKLIHWNPKLSGHHKVHPDNYQHDYIDTKQGRDYLLNVGFRKPVNSVKLVPRGAYISSAPEHKLSIERLLQLNTRAKLLDVPKCHDFISSCLIQGYQALYLQDRKIKLNGDLIKSENELYFVLNADLVRRIIEIVNA
jgi:hypothetical protein